ncbi:MAG: hypothetical protein JW959_06970 [Pirellulales bacterium]|nr:hypothetical protein [Pirellulales bacterium]
MNRKAWAAIGIIPLTMAVIFAIWTFQGANMHDDFVRALRSGDVAGPHRDLVGKQWTEEELATAEVLRLPGNSGRQRALTRDLHTRGRDVISGLQYEYQGTVRDNQTGIIHVFGLRRQTPQQWCWAAIHPSSLQEHLRQRMEQVEKLQQRRAD